jgi:hypothetical protein
MAVSHDPHPWDLKIGGVGLMLDPERDPQGNPTDTVIEGAFAPVEGQDQGSDQAVTWSDWSLGIGLPRLQNGRGGYSYGLNVYTRRRGKVMAAPKKTEVALPVGMASGVRITDIREFGNDLYLLTSGNQVLKATGGDPTSVAVVRTSAIGGFSGTSLRSFRGELLASGGTGLEILRSGTWQPFSPPVSQLGTVTWFFKNQPTTWLLGVVSGTHQASSGPTTTRRLHLVGPRPATGPP